MTPEQERILDHYQNPRHKVKFGASKNACGDEVRILLKEDQVLWSGTGCAYSMAAASMMAEHLHGKPVRDFTEQEMLDLFGMPVEHPRKDCVLVAYHALQDALRNI